MRIPHRVPIQRLKRLCPSATRASCCSAGPMCVLLNEGWLRPPSTKELPSLACFLRSAFPDSSGSWLGGVASFSPLTRDHGLCHLTCCGLGSILACVASPCLVLALLPKSPSR